MPRLLPDPSRLGLTLSGGGFRATLFHLGVIRFLFDVQRLHEVRQICSVSGGSILAAHLVLHWDRYTNYGNPDDFEKAAGEVVRFVKQDVRGNIERRLYLRAVFACLWAAAAFILIPQAYYRFGLTVAECVAGVWILLGLASVLRLAFGSRGRTDLLRRHYDALCRVAVTPAGVGSWFQRAAARVGRLFGASGRPRQTFRAAIASDLSKPGAPDLHILATSLTTRGMFAFDRDGLIWNDESVKPSDPPVRLIRGQLPLSLLVGASSAFPPFFPPVRIDHHVLRCRSDQFKTRHRLTDGGIYDNLGLEGMLVAGTGSYNLVVASDAESPLDLDEASFGSTTGRNFRATYILMERVGKDVRGRARAGLPLADCKLSNANVGAGAGPYATTPALQSDVVPIRTDLDGFTDIEIHLLVSHGYAVAREQWMRLGHDQPGPNTSEPWSPIPASLGLDVVKNNGSAIGDKARARWRRIRLHPWNAREPTSWLCVALLLCAGAAGLLWGFEYARSSDLASKADLLEPNDPIRAPNSWLASQLHALAAEADARDRAEWVTSSSSENEMTREIKVTGTPKNGWICARPALPRRCRLIVRDGYQFTGFIYRVRRTEQEVVAAALMPIDKDETEPMERAQAPDPKCDALPKGTRYWVRTVEVPQTPDPECDIVVVGRLLKSSDGEWPDRSCLDKIISLETQRGP